MFTNFIPTETYHTSEHYTAAVEIEIQARAEEKKMALLAAEYKANSDKTQLRGKSVITMLMSFLSL